MLFKVRKYRIFIFLRECPFNLKGGQCFFFFGKQIMSENLMERIFLSLT